MNAAQIADYGSADAITVRDDVRRPAAGQGQILVAMRAASLNPVDSVIRSGMMRQMLGVISMSSESVISMEGVRSTLTSEAAQPR